MSAPPFPPHFTPQGLRLHTATMRARFGAKGWAEFLRGLRVDAKPLPGMPPAALRNLRKHKCYDEDREAGTITLPKRMAAILARGGAIWPTEGPGLVASLAGVLPPARRLPAASCRLTAELYQYQAVYADYLLTHHLTGEKARWGEAIAYVNLKTGRGKTVVAIALAALLQVPMAVVVPTKDIQAAGVSTARRLLPELRVEAYSNAADKAQVKKGRPAMTGDTVDIMYIVINTACKKPPEFWRTFGLLALDEAHEYHAPTSSAILWAMCGRTVGLSASPLEQKNGIDRVVTTFLGPPLPLEPALVAMCGPQGADLVENFRFAGRVREVLYTGQPERIAEEMNIGSAILRIGNVILDPHRLEAVAAETERLLNLHKTLPPGELDEWGLGPDADGKVRRHSVFVFAEHRAYLPAIQAALHRRIDPGEIWVDEAFAADEAGAAGGEGAAGAAGGEGGAAAAPGADAAILMGGATEDDRALAHRSRVVLTTYGYSRRGVDYKHITAIVAASPRRNGLNQVLGRIERMSPDRSLLSIKRVVVDIRDSKSALDGQHVDRRAAYDAKGWPISQVKCSYSDFALPPAAATPAVEGEKPAVRRKRAPPGDAQKQKLQELLGAYQPGGEAGSGAAAAPAAAPGPAAPG